jgi:hypothetical protein
LFEENIIFKKAVLDLSKRKTIKHMEMLSEYQILTEGSRKRKYLLNRIILRQIVVKMDDDCFKAAPQWIK